MQVLIAHRAATAREALKRVVGAVPGADLEVIESNDGGETMELLLAADSPRIAVVDWDLPGCDGLELCRLARAYYEAGRPYLILLAREGHSIAEALEAGADDCVHMPVPADELRARIGVGRRFASLPGGRIVPAEAAAEPELDTAPTLCAQRSEDDVCLGDKARTSRSLVLESMLATQ